MNSKKYVLVANMGSSSIKLNLFEFDNNLFVSKAKVQADRVMQLNSNLKISFFNDQLFKFEKENLGIEEVLKITIEKLDEKFDFKSNPILYCAHRYVHGGKIFKMPLIVDKASIIELEKINNLAPLHNPSNLNGIIVMMNLLPKITQIAVFDTAIFRRVEEDSIYSLPIEISKRLGIEKYGFHGSSHKYVFEESTKFMDIPKEKLSGITCHLGSGCSITGWKNGTPIKNSMEYSPTSGLMMSTRTGDIDPIAVLDLAEEYGIEKTRHILTKESGLQGISGVKGGDLRDIINNMENGDTNSTLAFNMYILRIKEKIGEFIPVIGGLDFIAFTAGVGENSSLVREKVCEGFKWLGADINKNLNKTKKSGIISMEDSKIKILVIPTDEELMIAKESYNLLFSN